ncbi:hypothetical protein CS562_09000 [Paenibacillus sp. LK1]|nr:hypothetical protein CS562_09000 [Paenibacillus sp. LK1]
MFNNNDEIQAWELQQLQKYLKTQEKNKRNFDPRIKKLNEYRNHRKTKYYYNNEVKCIRKLTQRRFKMKFKHNIYLRRIFPPSAA